MIRGAGLAASLLAALAPSGTVAAGAAAPAEAYRAALAPVATCGDFALLAAALPDAVPLLRDLFAESLPERAAGESEQAFTDRAVRRLFVALGDPARLHLALPLEGLRVDAAHGLATITLPQPLAATLASWGEARVHVRGAAAPVATETRLRAEFDAAPGQLPPSLALPVTPAQAARLAAGKGRLQILAVFEDMGTDAASTAAPAGGGEATQTSYRLVRLRPRCALVTDGTAPIAGWRLDAWSAGGG